MKLLLLDGNSIINRAFYGIKLLTTKDGVYTNGIYGFMNILLKLLQDYPADGVVAAFDLKAPTFRHKMFEAYKAGRKGMPDELASQLPLLKELLTAFGYHVVEKEGYEADDIIGTLARYCVEQNHECVIATGDRDSLQLVSDHIHVWLAATKMGRPDVTIYDNGQVLAEYGVAPPELIDVKALMGDSSDNIPGVAGIGQKTASALIGAYHNIDVIYEQLDSLDIKESVRKKLAAGRDNAFLSRELGRIDCDVPLETHIAQYKSTPMDKQAATRILTHLEFFKMIEKLDLTAEPVAKPGLTSSGNVSPAYSYLPDQLPANIVDAARQEGELYLLPRFENGALTALPVLSGEQAWLLRGDDCRAFLTLLSDETGLSVYIHDVKQFYNYSLAQNISLRPRFDSALAAYLLNPLASDYSLNRLAQEYGAGNYRLDAENEEDRPYLEDVIKLKEICRALVPLLEENKQHPLYYDIEMPLAEVLAHMENLGFSVDKEGLIQYGSELEKKINSIETEIYSLVGYEFNLNSPKQLGDALFVKLGLPPKKKTKTGYSTDAEVLEGLRHEHPCVEMLLEYRKLSKLKSTYCDGLAGEIGPDGRIHSTLNQTETRTGRISSLNPNLQNIPVRQEEGRLLRKFFVAKEGCVLCDADYSQIELRLLANISGDKAMIDAFNSGVDIHTATASSAFGIPIPMITPTIRSRAKAVNFGIVYGIGPYSLAKDLGISFADAKKYIDNYFAAFPGVKRYMDDIVAYAKEHGYVETMFGRRRYLPELSSSNAAVRASGERIALNTPIQGTAADVIKIAMIKVRNRLMAENLTAKLILQVHDELIVEAPAEESDPASKILKEEMESAVTLETPLLSDVNVGKTWFDAK